MRVLISGAGIAGPTLAWFLAKAGARITVVEKSHSLLPHGQNVDIQGSALAVVKKMGLMSEIRRLNTTEEGTQLISPKGKPFASFPVRAGRSPSFTSQFEILRGDLAALLHSATKDLENVRYFFNTTVTSVLSNCGTSPVKVQLSSQQEPQEFDLVVAADGQWSKIRQQCFPPSSTSIIHKGMYAAYYTIPRLPSDNSWWNIYNALGSRIVTLRPDPHGTIRAMFTLMPLDDAQEREWMEAGKSDRRTQQELVRRTFQDCGWQARRLLDAMPQAPDFYFHVIQQIKMTGWTRNRVVCLGDAAFAPTPLTGMGTSLAMIGAYVLAGELSEVIIRKNGGGVTDEQRDPSRALEAYEKRFRPFVEEIQRIPSVFPDMAHPASNFKRWLLQTFVWGLAKVVNIPWVARRFGDEEADDQGFPLPEYGCFDSEGGIVGKRER
ncbi:MAG: hypothetical protein Q9219_003569 [cf. Caloplaca sp. 3 TL-2023]